jgi:Protein of unknown function (DUF2568)
MRILSLVLKFVVELAAFAAFGYWGGSVGSGATAVAFAVAAPALAIVLWGRFAAPRAERRLPTAARVPFELSIFGLAVVALFVAGAPTAAILLAMLAVTSAVLLARFDQWES